MSKNIDEYYDIFVEIFKSDTSVTTILRELYDTIYTYHNEQRKCDENIKIKLIPTSSMAHKYYRNEEHNYRRKKPKSCPEISPTLEYCTNEEFRENIDKFVTALDAELHIDTSTDNIKNVQIFKNVHTLILYHYYPNNLEYLKKLHTLTLNSCSSIRDLNSFKNVNKLSIKECDNISNVSMLGKLDTLILDRCKGIRDVGMLGTLNKLVMYGCPNAININMLDKINELCLMGIGNNIFDVSNLGNVRVLNICCCRNIKDVSNLKNVYDLDISCCDKITDISNLGNTHTLNISYCEKIKHTDNLQFVKHLTISYHHMKYLPHGLTKLCVHGCNKNTKINNLPSSITYLEVSGVLMHTLPFKSTNIKLKCLNKN
jgi:hypothetical protein